MEDDLERSEFYISKFRTPILIGVLIASIYLAELLLAGSTEYAAAYSFLTGLSERYDPLLRVLAPFLHSNHNHILWNLGFFLPLGVMVRTHTSPRDFVVIFVSAGWFSASLATGIIQGGLGFGISGANAALAGYEAVYRGRSLKEIANFHPGIYSKQYLIASLLFALPATLAILNLAQGFGLMGVNDGVSVVGHFTGVIFGIVLGIYELVMVDN